MLLAIARLAAAAPPQPQRKPRQRQVPQERVQRAHQQRGASRSTRPRPRSTSSSDGHPAVAAEVERVRARGRDAGKRGIGRDEERDGRRAERRGEMREAGVDADDDLGARASVASSGSDWRGGTIAFGDVLRRGARCARAPRRCPTAAAPRSRPARNARAARASRRSGHSLSSRLVPWNATAYGSSGIAGDLAGGAILPPRRSFDCVAQRGRGERTRLDDEVLVAVDRGGARRRARSRAARARSRGRSRGGGRARCVATIAPFTCSCRSRIASYVSRAQRVGGMPANSRHVRGGQGALRQRRNATGMTVPDARVERDERREASSATQSTAMPGGCALDVGDERERVHDVAERRRAHDEHGPHACGCAASLPRESIAAWGGPAPLSVLMRTSRECPNRFPCRSS